MIQAVVTGNLGRDPELKETRNGKAMCNLSVASTNPRRQDKDPETTWVDVVCFDEVAEGAASSLRKGQKVIVTGSLVLEQFKRRDGSDGQSLRLIASDVAQNIRARKDSNNHADSIPEPW